MAEINFHAVKAELPAKEIKELLKQLETDTKKTDIQLFNFSGVMYFRPTGQSLTIVPEESNATDINLIDEENDLLDIEPIVALLDGVPQLNHTRLKNRIRIDDPNNISEHYLVGQRLHGTSMASLIIHGELDSPASSPLKSPLYVAPILQPDQTSQIVVEHVPKNEFLEDRIEIAVRRIFEGQGTVEAQAPHVKIINLSIGDSSRPFINTLSPLARLIDYLSWKYRVIFVISAGNFTESIDLELREDDYKKLTNDGKVELTLKQIERNLFYRRILSPAESMNSITVGALHSDQTPTQQLVSNHTDILPSSMGLVSPISRLGYGFRKSVKPEIFFSGGKQLYNIPPSGTIYKINNINNMTGQKVAWDSITQGDLAKCAYTKGTSNATALATRGGAIIYDSLSDLQKSLNQKIPENLISVLIKTLLVHGARQGDEVKKTLINTYKTNSNSRKIKEVITRYTGYGSADIEKVVTCTEQRATVLGFGEIKQNEIHEYSFPLPPGLSQSSEWRRLVISLAWLTPINSNHRNLREAKLELSPAGTWNAIPLKLKRTDTDHNQVHRGTVQHEIFEGTKEISAFQDGENIKLRVICKADAITKLDEEIPYGLAVTLEVEEGVNINIYQQIRTGIRNQSQVKV
ncbi:S8 family peptidase [Rahnella victoriana]|uniref:S8 family peptidase n=1 Tax=Rahnella victoriana TaxID=1510570 RepID=UPI001E50DFE7|nr:S8 family peptidase [Rahnella victoriana]UHM90775.1 S8 family peptidase [Rahnella victoriana]